ncbi:hypothetical protein ENUP19_0350G0011 [Entamoeba nuttalli]|uniref:Spindle pole body component n=2 Tax=Entamoeba nuttalli TaxID=412467 RepID=K2GX69_ENTNP|nr:Spc97 / Spc98 family protein [Entamoeba nuttalli P19]EKE38397.1 Spc97 / Spc98 family protein [Entamoeba nuttalli P19]|eukprot:XP_008859259.1 Spc97 / Spc98 family protein [Entamoeba nuttalli P19]
MSKTGRFQVIKENPHVKSLCEQECILIDGIFGMCLCFSSEGIDIISTEKRKFAKLTKIIDSRLQCVVERIIDLAEDYSIINSFLKSKHEGVTQQALCEGIVEFREEYVNDICFVEKQARKEMWTIQEICCELNKKFDTLKPIREIIEVVTKETKPQKIIEVLYSQLRLFGGIGTSVKLLKKLIEKTCEPLMNFISQWMSCGELLYNEFFIKKEGEKYIFYEEEVPCCVQPHGNEIYITGNYVNSIKRYRIQHETELFQQMLLHQTSEIEEESKEEIPSIHLESITLFNPLKFKQLITKQAELINKMLFVIFQHCHIDDTFNKIRKTYLLGEPSFYYNFFDVSHGILSNAYSADEELRSTYKLFDSLLFELKSIHLSSNCFSVSFQKEFIQNYLELTTTDKPCNMFQAFLIRLVIPFPLSLIVNDEATLRYQVIFKFLFDIEYHRYLLSRAFTKIICKSTELGTNRNYSTLRFYLQQLLLICSKTLEEIVIYCQCDVITKLWNKFISTPKYSVNDLKELHSKFLNDCLTGIGLNETVLFNSYNKLLIHIRYVLQTVYAVEKMANSGDEKIKKQPEKKDYEILESLSEETRIQMDGICSLLPNTSIEKRNCCFNRLNLQPKQNLSEEDPFADILNKK